MWCPCFSSGGLCLNVVGSMFWKTGWLLLLTCDPSTIWYPRLVDCCCYAVFMATGLALIFNMVCGYNIPPLFPWGKGTPDIWYNFRVLAAWVRNVQCSGRTMLLVSSAVEGLFIETTLFWEDIVYADVTCFENILLSVEGLPFIFKGRCW